VVVVSVLGLSAPALAQEPVRSDARRVFACTGIMPLQQADSSRTARQRVEKQLETAKPAASEVKDMIKNSIGMKLKLIPAGSFLMGATPDDARADDIEKPQHKVTITRPFYLGVYEVTQYEHKQVMGANPSEIRGDDEHVYTAPVGSFAPNAWGLYDMLGNVREWCDDCYDAKFYQSSPKGDPHNTAGASPRVIRGGAWGSHPMLCRPACRDTLEPADRAYSLGFRVAAVQE